MAKAVTKAQAEKVLAEVRRVFRVYIKAGYRGPSLKADFDWGAGPAPWAVIWEEGPFEWAYNVTSGGVDEELVALGSPNARIEAIRQPAGVYCEPYTSWALAIYPE